MLWGITRSRGGTKNVCNVQTPWWMGMSHNRTTQKREASLSSIIHDLEALAKVIPLSTQDIELKG
jgi:hypothetical protein